MHWSIALFIGLLAGLVIGALWGWHADIATEPYVTAAIERCADNGGFKSMDGYTVSCKNGARFANAIETR